MRPTPPWRTIPRSPSGRSGGEAGGLAPPRFSLGLFRRGFAQGVATGVLVVVAQVATAVGFAQDALAERAG